MIKSYRDMSRVGKRIKHLDDAGKSIVGLFCLGKDISQMDEFLTNRYFQEAIGIERLPTADELNQKLSYNTIIEVLRAIAADIMNGINPPTPCRFDIDLKVKLDRDGYAVIPNVLDQHAVEFLRKLVVFNAALEKENNAAYLYGKNCQRVYNLLNKGIAFQSLITNELVIEIMDHMFDRETLHDKYYLSSWHANLLGPGATAGMLHLDAAVPDPIPPWIIRANICFMLDDFTEENGATLCSPGSHKLCSKPNLRMPHNKPVAMTGKAGSLAIWHGHLWHKSGTNSTNKERIGLLGCFANSVLREMCLEENHFRIVDDMKNMSEELKILIGYDHGIKKGAL